MKKFAFKVLLATTVLFTITDAAHADPEISKTAAYGFDTYTCEELIQLDEEKVESVIYYIRGHYDSKHDIWADYEPSKQKKLFEDDFYAPVEKVEEFCKKNPKTTVVEALTTYNH